MYVLILFGCECVFLVFVNILIVVWFWCLMAFAFVFLDCYSRTILLSCLILFLMMDVLCLNLDFFILKWCVVLLELFCDEFSMCLVWFDVILSVSFAWFNRWRKWFVFVKYFVKVVEIVFEFVLSLFMWCLYLNFYFLFFMCVWLCWRCVWVMYFFRVLISAAMALTFFFVSVICLWEMFFVFVYVFVLMSLFSVVFNEVLFVLSKVFIVCWLWNVVFAMTSASRLSFKFCCVSFDLVIVFFLLLMVYFKFINFVLFILCFI